MSSKFKKISPKTNTIYRGDNLEIMRAMPDSFIDLCYIDPPFFTQRDYKNIWGDKESVLDWDTAKFNGFFDTRDFFERHVQNGEKGLTAYLAWMRARLVEIHRILKPTGVLYLHLDHHAVHYMKVILDEIFGYSNFRSEIVWKRINSKGLAFKGFATNTDIILQYTKSKNFTWNAQYRPHDPEYVRKFYRHDDEDGRGAYQIADLANPGYRPNLIYPYKGYQPPSKGWRVSKEKMQKLDKEGRLVFPESKEGRIRKKSYLSDMKGNPIDNVWDDIKPVQAQSEERMGWPTQKPVALLERIISASTNEGDLVFDCFAGCGTSMHAAHKLKRKWVGIDISPTAMKVNKKRLEALHARVNIVDEKELEQTEVTKSSQKKAA